MGNSKRLFIRFRNYITAVICSAGIAACIGFLLYHTGIYLQGSAIYAQLYKLDEVMDSMQQGTLFPLYARHWYNGYEIFRLPVHRDDFPHIPRGHTYQYLYFLRHYGIRGTDGVFPLWHPTEKNGGGFFDGNRILFPAFHGFRCGIAGQF